MRDLELSIIIAFARTSVSLIATFATWLIVRGQLIHMPAETEEDHA